MTKDWSVRYRLDDMPEAVESEQMTLSDACELIRKVSGPNCRRLALRCNPSNIHKSLDPATGRGLL